MANEEAASTRPESEEVAATAQPANDTQTSPGAGEEPPHLEAPSIAALEEEIVQLMAKVNDQAETVLRAQAEMQNVRRRAERDVENAHKFALDKFTADLLPILDSLERAMGAADQLDNSVVKAMRDGVELTLKMFVDTLAKHGVQQLNPVGEPFNPDFHEAMTMVPNAELPPNSVMAVMQRGYTLNGRLVRPAMVVVTRAA